MSIPKCECGAEAWVMYVCGTRVLWCDTCGRETEWPYRDEQKQEAELKQEAEWLGIGE